jgi:hypothetical protein
VVSVDDEQPVGDLASDGADEPLGIAGGSRTPWRDLHDLDTGVGEDGVERSGDLAGPVADQEPEVSGPTTEVRPAGALSGHALVVHGARSPQLSGPVQSSGAPQSGPVNECRYAA